MTPAKPKRGRPPKKESFASWLQRIDAEVETAAREAAKQPLSLSELPPGQRKIVEMLIGHLRTLPRLRGREEFWRKPEYGHINGILTRLFRAQHPEWDNSPRLRDGSFDETQLPQAARDDFRFMLENCAGSRTRSRPDEDDD